MKNISLLIILGMLLLIVISACSNNITGDATVEVDDEESQDVDQAQDSQMEEVSETNRNVIDMDYCESDDDCSCGMSLETADCYIGNRDYIDTGATDYHVDAGLCERECNGKIGNLELKCVENTCKVA